MNCEENVCVAQWVEGLSTHHATPASVVPALWEVVLNACNSNTGKVEARRL